MAFKLKSGNKVSFKNMGGSPGKQSLFSDESYKKPTIADPTGEEKSFSDYEKNIGKKWQQGTEGKYVALNKTTNKEAGDKKSKWGFDWMQLLDSFLTSGGGKKGLLKAAGAALQSPNERLEAQEERKIKKVKVQDMEKEGLGD